ncbi:hypothetical protein K461DRAFT_296114 [Myriangium duriaei CBS 260.36]|uniref:Uncharacterized protein n=1 Tax=Myriangium duriaei CBS 260.36 TaxID=1168546 RepID=A0A9P4MFB1_9PEZI|nr:hypothetical protein K461DRAFT_296114 [Myriangium duriaei CBS 260.36]
MAEAPRTRFAPPSGYAKVEAYNASSILDLSSLGSKQLWHITIPRGISINDLTSVSQDGLDSKTTVLTHKGTEYTFADAAQPGQEGVNKALLLPSSSEKAYRSRPVSVSRSIRLQPKVSLPNVPNRQTDVATGSSAAGQTTRLAVSSIRPQPKGLKMRYKPPGFGSGRPGTIGSGSEDSDTDMEDAPPANQGFRRPNIAASTAQSAQTNGTKASPAKKRKLDEAKSSTPAKSKSKKSSAAPPATPPAEDPESDPEPTAQPTPKDSKHLTKEERAARRQRKAERAEKRAKKANAG